MISVVCPVYNEEAYISKVLEFFVSALPVDKEIFIVDGNSTDRTTVIVNEFANKHTNIFLLNNPSKTVPFALNMAIPKCKGEFIIRLDAHTEYAPDYFEQIIKSFKETGADIVGGPMRTVGKTDFQKAVAYATCTRFGVGDSAFHDEMKSGYVDSVYLGAWKKEIFNDVGYFDETLKRNQDDDFHYRAKAKGKKIFLNPQIKSFYYPRDTAKKLFLQYFQYGLYKPIVLKKTMTEIKLRHLIPSAFLLYLISLPVLLFFSSLFWLPSVLYLALSCWYAISSHGNLSQKVYTFMSYPLLHISYGSGFLAGLAKT
jgi:glycosyltransferase involved in cell wall biosynthesis